MCISLVFRCFGCGLKGKRWNHTIWLILIRQPKYSIRLCSWLHPRDTITQSSFFVCKLNCYTISAAVLKIWEFNRLKHIFKFAYCTFSQVKPLELKITGIKPRQFVADKTNKWTGSQTKWNRNFTNGFSLFFCPETDKWADFEFTWKCGPFSVQNLKWMCCLHFLKLHLT